MTAWHFMDPAFALNHRAMFVRAIFKSANVSPALIKCSSFSYASNHALKKQQNKTNKKDLGQTKFLCSLLLLVSSTPDYFIHFVISG